MSPRRAGPALVTAVGRRALLLLLVALTVVTSGHVHAHDHVPASHGVRADGAAASHDANGSVDTDDVQRVSDDHRDATHAEVGVRSVAAVPVPAGGDTVSDAQDMERWAVGEPPMTVGPPRTPVSERTVIRT